MDIKESFQSIANTVMERLVNPFVGAFIVAWCLLNFRNFVAVFIGDQSFADRLAHIDAELYPTWRHWAAAFLWPVPISISWLLLMPHVSRAALNYQKRQDLRTNADQLSLAGKSVVEGDHHLRLVNELRASNARLRTAESGLIGDLDKANQQNHDLIKENRTLREHLAACEARCPSADREQHHASDTNASTEVADNDRDMDEGTLSTSSPSSVYIPEADNGPDPIYANFEEYVGGERIGTSSNYQYGLRMGPADGIKHHAFPLHLDHAVLSGFPLELRAALASQAIDQEVARFLYQVRNWKVLDRYRLWDYFGGAGGDPEIVMGKARSLGLVNRKSDGTEFLNKHGRFLIKWLLENGYVIN